MRLTGAVLLCFVLGFAAEGKAENGAFRIEKRTSNDGNASIDKRTPSNGPTAQPPAIEYAESTTAQSDVSPTQQVYSTPAPAPTKLSDVVSGQHGPVPAAVAAHLHSRIPLYQTRFAVPTTYEVSAPVASQLAYSEHKMYLDAQQNPGQYYSDAQGIIAPPPKPLARLAVRYPQQVVPAQQQQQQQHIVFIPQQVLQQYGQNVQHLQPVLPYPQIQHTDYNQQPVEYTRSQVQPQVFVQQPQPGVEYAQKTEASHVSKYAVQAAPKEVRIAPVNVAEKQTQNNRPSGAVSYVSFSQNSPPVQQAPAPRPLVKIEALSSTPNSIPQVQKPGFAPLILVRVPTPRYFPQPQLLQPAPLPQVHHHQQPQQYYQPQGVVLQNTPYQHQQQLSAVAPTFPPIQYFGKFAPQIFGTGQH